MITTSCRDCCFAEYVGDTQDGCRFDRLDKFEQQGAEVVGLDDGEKQFFVINGRFCTACRNHEWAARQVGDLMAIARAEFTAHITMVIYACNGTTIKDMEATLGIVLGQALPPRAVKVIFEDGDPNGPAYNLIVRELGLPCPYQFHQVMEVHHDDAYGRAVDIGLADCKTNLYTVARAGYRWHPDFVRRIDHALNDELVRFVALRPDASGNALVVQTGLHNSVLGGNQGKPIFAKIMDIARQEETTFYLIKDWEDLPCV